MMGREVHLKDKRVPGGWAFYEFDDDQAYDSVSTRDGLL